MVVALDHGQVGQTLYYDHGLMNSFDVSLAPTPTALGLMKFLYLALLVTQGAGSVSSLKDNVSEVIVKVVGGKDSNA